ncbi:caspase domain-containing protein [Fibrella sp. WM1]
MFTLLFGLILVNGGRLQAQTVQGTSAPGRYAIRSTNQTTRTDYALLIANDTYADPAYTKLVNPVYDAQQIEAVLRERFGFQTTLLTTANRDSCLRQLRRLANRTFGPNDQLFVYVAGHGDFDPVFRQGYVVLRDARKSDETYAQHLSFPDLQNILGNLRCRHVLLTLDVCYGGTFDNYFATQDLAAFRGDSLSRGGRVADAASPTAFIYEKLKPATRLYLSSGGKEVVADGQRGQHSPFAKHLLAKLEEAAQSQYKVLTVSELKVYLEKQNLRVKMGPFPPNESNSDFLFIAR